MPHLLPRVTTSFLLACTLTCVTASSARSGDTDWPQWRGPNRDGHAAPQELLQDWPSGGPPMSWTAVNLGTGYSTVSVVDGKVFTMGANDDECFAICLSLGDGSEIWKTPVARAGNSGDYNDQWGAGPRGTPTVDGDQVFVVTDIGTVAALAKDTGELLWSTSMTADHGGQVPTWGYSESPLVDGDRVVVTPGENNFMIALDRNSGKKVWGSKGIHEPAQYVSIMRGQRKQTAFYLTASKSGLIAVDCKSGDEVFRDTATGNQTAVIPTPILHDRFIYHTSAYGAGNTLLKIKDKPDGLSVQSVYALSNKSMENNHGGVVLVNDVIYGFTKSNGGNWMAQDMQSGDTLWEQGERPNRSGAICYADGRLYCYNDQDGTVHLAEPNRSDWISHGKLTLPKQTELDRGKGAIWTHPVVAAGKLIIRDQDLMYAYDIAAD
ncbi:outer membrane protein assembly factor BamB family protein [Stieleria varia]|uniref:Outer membrane biogenesis protein BamB n=1 Tax=Stieleria varia TaxID=2528005 RepID=A0A5C6AHU1_9BACT|nr:PQQ-binding-like beta-propeller repeat protein [Stieleria varia]TWT98611.1 outer membrane biogenesis protein BamB [Stieleria varia]